MSRRPSSRAVRVVSHGFQSHYELGFVNGLAANGFDVVLFGSDTTLAGRLHPRVQLRNVRGSQDPGRPLWRKAVGMLAYHARLLVEVVRGRGAPFVCIGIQKPEWSVGVLESLWIRAWAGSWALVVHNVLPFHDRSGAVRRVHRVLYRIPRWLLVHTETSRAALQREFGIAQDRILLVPHGMNDAVQRSTLTRAQAKTALGFEPDARLVMQFGRYGPYKGVDLLLDAMDALPDLRLVMAGRIGHDAECAAIRTRLRALVRQGRAWWRDDHVDDEEVARLFAAVDVTVLPYRHIDQSGVLLLSLTLGVPVLTTPVGGFTELVRPGRNGAWIASASVEDVRCAIEAFFAAPPPSPDAVRATVAHLAWARTLRAYVDALVAAHPGALRLSEQGRGV